jgi:hypothetical protein
MRPDDLLPGNFLIIDIDPRLGLSFFREAGYRFQAYEAAKSRNAKKQFLIRYKR